VASCSASMIDISISAYRTRGPRHLPARGPSRRRRRRPTQRKGPRRWDPDRRRPPDDADLHEFGVPFIMNDSPELAATVGAERRARRPTRTSACRAVANSWAMRRSWGCRHIRAMSSTTRSISWRPISAGPIIARPTKPGRAGTGITYAVSSQARSDRPVFVTGGVNEENVANSSSRGFATSSSWRCPHRSQRARSRGATDPAAPWTRRCQRCRSSQPNNVATIRGSARS